MPTASLLCQNGTERPQDRTAETAQGLPEGTSSSPVTPFNRAAFFEFMSTPFRNRNYGLFGFLAGVRNYARCEPLARPRGLPAGCDAAGGCRVNNIDSLDDFHSHSWFLVSELLAFDYDRQFWNRRIHRGKDGAALAREGEGVHKTYREFLGLAYMDTLESLKRLGKPGQVRVFFCFGD